MFYGRTENTFHRVSYAALWTRPPPPPLACLPLYINNSCIPAIPAKPPPPLDNKLQLKSLPCARGINKYQFLFAFNRNSSAIVRLDIPWSESARAYCVLFVVNLFWLANGQCGLGMGEEREKKVPANNEIYGEIVMNLLLLFCCRASAPNSCLLFRCAAGEI